VVTRRCARMAHCNGGRRRVYRRPGPLAQAHTAPHGSRCLPSSGTFWSILAHCQLPADPARGPSCEPSPGAAWADPIGRAGPPSLLTPIALPWPPPLPPRLRRWQGPHRHLGQLLLGQGQLLTQEPHLSLQRCYQPIL